MVRRRYRCHLMPVPSMFEEEQFDFLGDLETMSI